MFIGVCVLVSLLGVFEKLLVCVCVCVCFRVLCVCVCVC